MFLGINSYFRRCGDTSYPAKRGEILTRVYIPNPKRSYLLPFIVSNQYHTSHTCSIILDRQSAREDLKISRELQFILQLPVELYDLFLIRFDWFKVRQTENDFNELDEVSQLIQDVREIVYKNEDVNKIAAEVALATLSQYCKDIDLLFLKKARENILFEDLRKTLSNTDQWAHCDKDNSERKVLTFWEIFDKIPKLEIKLPSTIKEEKLPSTIQEEKLPITIKEEKLPNSIQDEESPHTRNELEQDSLPQKEKKEEEHLPHSQIPMKLFLHKQLLALLAILNYYKNNEVKASRALGLTPPQMSNLIKMICDGIEEGYLKPRYKHALITYDKGEKKRIDKRNKMKKERKVLLRLLEVEVGFKKK